MKRFETKDRSKDELMSVLKEMKGRLTQLNFDMAEKKVNDTTQTKKIKKDIARILTALNK